MLTSEQTADLQVSNGIRDLALSLPFGHPARTLYRDYVRSQANVAEDIRATGTSTSGALGEQSELIRARMEAAVIAAARELGFMQYHYDANGKRIG